MARGRPKSFDPEIALDRAVEVFWSQGYDGASLPLLVSGMGIGRQSLYDTFGDKRTLFLRALEVYSERRIADLRSRLERGSSASDAIVETIRSWAERENDAPYTELSERSDGVLRGVPGNGRLGDLNGSANGSSNGVNGLNGSSHAATGNGTTARAADDANHGAIARGCLAVNTLTEVGDADRDIADAVRSYLGAVESLLQKALTRARSEGALDASVAPDAVARHLVGIFCGASALRRLPDTDPVLEELVNGASRGVASAVA